ncbi:MAG: hypothetical protein LUD72_04210, partial [Bacteroidales bacterium]|nr:hypothetical protein [Bacteroidales bacterium]
EPSSVDASLWASYGGFSTSFGGGVMGQLGMGTAAVFGGVGTAGGMGVGVWALPAYDVALMSADLSYKRSLIRSDMTYKVTAGPNGTHLIHLTPVPGSPFSFGPGGHGTLSLHNCVCWYTYYDVTSDNIDECRRANTNLLMTPDQMPLRSMDYDYMNEPTQAIVRQMAFGHAAEMLGIIRGTFQGVIAIPGQTLTMEYVQLITMGQKEREDAKKSLEERMQRMSPFEVMKKQAELMNSMLEIKKGVPLASYIKVI